MLDLELYNVMDEFFRRTNAWRYGQDIELTEELDYPLAVPAGATIVRALGVTHKGFPLTPASTGGGGTDITVGGVGAITPEEIFPDGDAVYLPDLTDLVVDTGIFSYAIYRPDYITITGTPDVEARKYPLRLLAALTLGGKCIEKDCGDWPVPDWAWDHYFRAWYDGVLYTLYGMPNKPWSNAQLATTHARRYRNREAFHKQEAA